MNKPTVAQLMAEIEALKSRVMQLEAQARPLMRYTVTVDNKMATARSVTQQMVITANRAMRARGI